MLVLIGNADGLGTRKNWLDLILSIAHTAEDFLLGGDSFGGGELSARNALRAFDDLKFPGSQAGVKMGADLVMSDLAHTTAQPVADQGAFVYNRLALEVLVAGKGEGFPDTVKRVHGLSLMLEPLMGCPDNSLGLVSKVCRQLSVRSHYLGWRMDLFTVAGRVRSDLGGFLSSAARAFEVFTNLLAARTGCVEIFLCVSLDLGRTAPSGPNFVAELA
jgi:hypothetical protein